MEAEKNKIVCMIDRPYVNTLIKERDRELHKGDCGRVLIVAGSKGMAGASILCARGALRTGAGLVSVAVTEDTLPIVQSAVPEAVCISRTFPNNRLEQYDSIVIGPGLGDANETKELMMNILSRYEGTVILDADGLNMLEGRPERLKAAAGKLVITPHPGETGRLLGCSTAAVNTDRIQSCRLLSEKTGAVSVLKGARTVVATPEGKTYINTTGNPGMATGGSGDVLSGMIASLSGQGLGLMEAAAAGVYLHGLAGDLAAEAMGEYGLIASDLAYYAAQAIKSTLENNRSER